MTEPHTLIKLENSTDPVAGPSHRVRADLALASGIACPDARILLARAAAAPFASFWLAGYEGADHVNSSGLPLAMSDVTQHEAQPAADYARLAEFDIRTVRESAGWRRIERHRRYDFSTLHSRAYAARALGVQVAWTLCHYGWPGDIDVFSAAFVDRFARYARAAATDLGDSTRAPVYTPINEISYLAWAVCESGRMHPSHAKLKDRRHEFKRQLVRASIAACEAILEVDPRARFLQTDPMMHIVAPAARSDLAPVAARQRERQFEAWDMLCGLAEPGLGGDPRYLDLVGVNYYCGNQWELVSGRALHWRLDDPRRKRLQDMLAAVHQRYARPVVVAETSHVGVGRGAWIQEVAAEVQAARERGVPVEGICLYPIIDRPEWDNPSQWHRSGLWDLELCGGGLLQRRLDPHYAAALKDAQLMTGTQRQVEYPALQSADYAAPDAPLPQHVAPQAVGHAMQRAT